MERKQIQFTRRQLAAGRHDLSVEHDRELADIYYEHLRESRPIS
jgi:hypothetical protein